MGIEVVADEHDRKQHAIRTAKRSGRTDEILAHEELRREFADDRLDPTTIKNPEKKYRYKIVYDEGRRTRFTNDGYEPVPFNDPAQLPGAKKIEGAQEAAGGLLMRTPMENYEKRVRRAKNRQRLLETGHTEEAKDAINRIARDELRSDAHKDVAFSETREE